MKILVVEDEQRLARNLRAGLEAESHVVDLSFNGTEGYDLASSGDYDLIILDLMLPGQDGISICKKLRQEEVNSLILMLTAKSSTDDKVTGLNSGADDYLAKPFDFEELLARIKSLSRRPAQIVTPTAYLDLSQKESQLLEYLQKAPSRFVNKAELLRRVWPYDTNILSNTIEATIKNIRQKVGKTIILTRRGLGYKYVSKN